MFLNKQELALTSYFVIDDNVSMQQPISMYKYGIDKLT